MTGRARAVALGLLAAGAALAAVAGMAAATRPVRGAVRAFTELVSAANAQDIDGVRALCTDRYLATHRPEAAEEGGVVGLPRNIHKNFRAWRQGEEVWICPTNRVGPVYRLVPGARGWRFDGPVGVLRPGGELVPLDDSGGDGGSV